MEAVAWLAGEPHSDRPSCASLPIAALMRSWNDSLDEESRNRLLKPLLPRLVGSRSTPAVEKKRSLLALDWLIRTYMPAWLDLVPSLAEDAATLRSLPEIVDEKTAEVGEIVRAIEKRASAAGSAAYSAAESAAYYAAESAAYYAAYYAAGSAARSALKDTVDLLQVSALDLIERMIGVGE